MFLAALALSHSAIIAAKAAKVPRCTAYRHRTEDAQFSAQWEAAEAYAIQLLHDACFKSVLEGDCEPIYWQGVRVGHIRKFDSRLRIEMLRAHMPERFKQPGGTMNVNVDARQQAVVFTPDMQSEVVSRRRAAQLKARDMELADKPEKAESIDQLLARSYGHAMPPITIEEGTH